MVQSLAQQEATRAAAPVCECERASVHSVLLLRGAGEGCCLSGEVVQLIKRGLM